MPLTDRKIQSYIKPDISMPGCWVELFLWPRTDTDLLMKSTDTESPYQNGQTPSGADTFPRGLLVAKTNTMTESNPLTLTPFPRPCKKPGQGEESDQGPHPCREYSTHCEETAFSLSYNTKFVGGRRDVLVQELGVTCRKGDCWHLTVPWVEQRGAWWESSREGLAWRQGRVIEHRDLCSLLTVDFWRQEASWSSRVAAHRESGLVILGRKDVWHLHPTFTAECMEESLSGFHRSTERTTEQRRDKETKRASQIPRTSEVTLYQREDWRYGPQEGCPL